MASRVRCGAVPSSSLSLLALSGYASLRPLPTSQGLPSTYDYAVASRRDRQTPRCIAANTTAGSSACSEPSRGGANLAADGAAGCSLLSVVPREGASARWAGWLAPEVYLTRVAAFSLVSLGHAALSKAKHLRAMRAEVDDVLALDEPGSFTLHIDLG